MSTVCLDSRLVFLLDQMVVSFSKWCLLSYVYGLGPPSKPGGLNPRLTFDPLSQAFGGS